MNISGLNFDICLKEVLIDDLPTQDRYFSIFDNGKVYLIRILSFGLYEYVSSYFRIHKRYPSLSALNRDFIFTPVLSQPSLFE